MDSIGDSLDDAELQEFIAKVAKMESQAGTPDLDQDTLKRLITESARLANEVRRVVPGNPWHVTVWALTAFAVAISKLLFF